MTLQDGEWPPKAEPGPEAVTNQQGMGQKPVRPGAAADGLDAAAGVDAPGLLGDRYQPLQLLGKKAGRQTWLATDLQTQEAVVVKLLLFSPDFQWDDLKLFEREAETLRSLSHACIPRYLDAFEWESAHGKGFAIVQSYIPALSLQQHLKAGHSFTEAEVKQLAQALLSILQYLHDRQPPVIHRDIKPSNILLTDRSGNSPSQVYLVDFGSVQTLAAREGGTITVVGTYGYMPPEQFGGRAFAASDLYSLGATLIYLVSGQHPADLPQTDLRLEFESVTRLSPSFSRWLRWLTEPSLNKRPGSAQEALTRLLQKPARSAALRGPRPQPANSKIQIKRTAQSLDILIPSRNFIIPTAISCTSLLVIGFSILFIFPLLAYALWAICALPFFLLANLFGRTRIQVTPEQIQVTRELFRWHLNRFIDAPKRHVWKLAVPAYATQQMALWVGTQKCEITVASRAELEWLAYELSEWLDLPISEEYF
jgi:serine/threonine protein kinase